MAGIVNRPYARVTALYCVPDGLWTATRRAPGSGAPEESATTPAIAAVVTPWAVEGRGVTTATAARTPILNTKRFICWISEVRKKEGARARKTCRSSERPSIRASVTLVSRRPPSHGFGPAPAEPRIVDGDARQDDQEGEARVQHILHQRVHQHVEGREHEQRRHDRVADHAHRPRHDGGRPAPPHHVTRPRPDRGEPEDPDDELIRQLLELEQS